jgi:diguanylate cyclase (GGDEF)-like protein
VNRLFARQLATARTGSGDIDIDRLRELVVSAYQQFERDRQRTDRSIGLMVEELDELNRGLEGLVSERTAVLRQREKELHEQNLRFDAALSNMSQALMLYDDQSRLVISNRRYREMYRLPPEAGQPGTSAVDLLRERMAVGTFQGDPEKYVEAARQLITGKQSVSRFSELPDGRTISEVMRAMPGGGWVVTHEDVTEQRESERKIAHMARHDSLTDLPNRAFLQEKLACTLAEMSASERIAVLHMDLDQFKGINDTLGHTVGDELLKQVATRLLASVGRRNVVARVGGDEFAVIQTGIVDPADAAALARRVRDAIRLPYRLHGHAVVADASIGIAIAPDDGQEPNELLKNADMALYGAKADGRSTFRFFEPAMDARMKARRTLELDLRSALADGAFALRYQPVVNLANDTIVCCEALLRWQHPTRGEVLPAEFIAVAEEIGLIVPIGEWVLRTACAEARRWPAEVKVAVNLSPIQVMSRNLVPVIVNALAECGLPASRLELEITESVLMQDTAATLSTLHRLRALGIRISMDDFGTGYSSLGYLRAFPFDKIKIDQSFVGDLPGSWDTAAIVRAITGLARSLDMVTTAEGVETEAQREQVRTLGCDEIQGYLIGRPLAAADIGRFLAGSERRFSVA